MFNYNINIDTLDTNDKLVFNNYENDIVMSFKNYIMEYDNHYIDKHYLNHLIIELNDLNSKDIINKIFDEDYDIITFEMKIIRNQIIEYYYPDYMTQDRYEDYDNSYIDDDLIDNYDEIEEIEDNIDDEYIDID